MAGPRRASRAAASAFVLAALALPQLGRSCVFPCRCLGTHGCDCSDPTTSHTSIKVPPAPRRRHNPAALRARAGGAQDNGCCIDTAFECPTTCTSRETPGTQMQATQGGHLRGPGGPPGGPLGLTIP
jgi:hypothetical protein